MSSVIIFNLETIYPQTGSRDYLCLDNIVNDSDLKYNILYDYKSEQIGNHFPKDFFIRIPGFGRNYFFTYNY